MKTSFAVMMHPKRKKYIPYFRNILGGNIPIIMDNGKGVWDTARRAWLSYDKTKEYHCVIQDDVILCKDFEKRVDSLISKNGKDYVYNLFIRNKGQEELANKWKDAFKIGYLIWWKLNWALAIVIPTKYIEEMIRFCDKMTEARYINRDDERMKVFFKQKGVQICYPLPCLVEHRQNENSLIGFGENKGRKAIKFIDDENT